MDNSKCPSKQDKFKIGLLLKEYGTIRNEIVIRIAVNYAILGFLFASVFGVITLHDKFSPPTFWYGILGIVAILGLFWWNQGRLMCRCSNRVAKIEREINILARDNVLRWESELAPISKWRWMFSGDF